MQVFILRHGIAEDGRPGGRDADRALTPDGKRKLRATLEVARAAGCAPQVLLTSPFRRAVESATIAAEVLGFKGDIIEAKAFVPSADPYESWDEIRLYSDSPSVLLASHEPLTGRLIAHLCGAPELQVDVKKGSVTRIDVNPATGAPGGILKWILTPKLAGSGSD